MEETTTPKDSSTQNAQEEVFEATCECGVPYKINQWASKRRPYTCECGRRFWWKQMRYVIAGAKVFKFSGSHVLLTSNKPLNPNRRKK